MRLVKIIACALTFVAPSQSAFSQSAAKTHDSVKNSVEWAPAQTTFVQLVHQAIDADNPVRITELFKVRDTAQSVPINANIGTASEGATFLDYAAARCKANAIEALIANGADPNVVYSSKATQQARTLFLAAATCREVTDEPYIRKAITAFFTGRTRANPNPVDALSATIARPQFHAFIEDCQRFNPTKGYLVVTEEWIRGGLDPGAAATAAQGGVTSLHVAAADPLHPVCKDIALTLAQAATSQDFLKKDNKNRIPVDYTFGPARKQSKSGPSGILIEYWIDCLAYAGNNSQIWRHQNQILNTYLSRNNTARDLARACGTANGIKPVVNFGRDTSGRSYIWQTRVLPGNKGNATIDDPACDASPDGDSSCQYLSVYPVDGRYELTTDYKLVWKEMDSSCTQFNAQKPSNPIVELGFRECDAKCGNSNAIYFDVKFEASFVDGKRRASRAMRRVAGLYKNWTDRAICIGLLVYLK
jgi:hypothetical protein